jgi:hypothetical protein
MGAALSMPAAKAQGWGSAIALANARKAALADIRKIVHEGVHAIRAAPATKPAGASPSNGWPDYLYDHHDHGAYEAARWRPTPQQIDWGTKVVRWYGLWRGKDRIRNGLEKWEWTLLEIRGWQAMFGRESWESLATLLNDRPNLPTYSAVHWRRRHDLLISIALDQAIACRDVTI